MGPRDGEREKRERSEEAAGICICDVLYLCSVRVMRQKLEEVVVGGEDGVLGRGQKRRHHPEMECSGEIQDIKMTQCHTD